MKSNRKYKVITQITGFLRILFYEKCCFGLGGNYTFNPPFPLSGGSTAYGLPEKYGI
jgi:hypothetical protein